MMMDFKRYAEENGKPSSSCFAGVDKVCQLLLFSCDMCCGVGIPTLVEMMASNAIAFGFEYSFHWEKLFAGMKQDNICPNFIVIVVWLVFYFT